MFQGTGFGGATSSPFSSSTFGKPATSAFGAAAPVFGSSGNTSLFGPSTSASTGFFGSSAAPTFGQPQTSQSTFGGFGGGTSQFGQQQNANTSGGLFGTSGTPFGSVAGAKPTTFGGFGAGTSQPSTGLFGAQTSTAQTPSLFGQPPGNQTAPSLFSAGFGGGGGTTLKFNPVTGSDTMVKNGQNTTISTRHQCITCMKEYDNKSLEELRMEDYMANRKGGAAGATGLFGATPGQTPGQPGGLFGAGSSQPSTGLFGATTENKGLFGSSTTGFGTGTGTMFGTGSATGGGLFNKPAATATPFGATSASTPSTSFGFNPQTTTNMFGSTQTSGFFSNTSQSAPAFGTPSTGFGFGTNQQQGSLFGQNKTGFSLGTSTQNTGISFGSTATSTAASGFGNKPAGFSTFGTPATTTSAFTSPFGQPNNQNASFFGGSNNFKAPTSTFNFGQTSTTNTLGGGLNLGTNTGGSLFGNTQAKPGSLFGSTNQTGGGLFGMGSSLGSTNTTGGFGTLGGGFGTSTLGGTSGGLGASSGGSLFGQPQQPIQQNNSQLNQHILALASMPFGDSPLFKNLLPSTNNKADESVKVTSPAAQKALVSGINYKVSPNPGSKLRIIKPKYVTKNSLFEGLDEDDNVLDSSGSGRPRSNVRRLTLRSRVNDSNFNASASVSVNSGQALAEGQKVGGLMPGSNQDGGPSDNCGMSPPMTPFTRLLKKNLLTSPMVDSPGDDNNDPHRNNADSSSNMAPSRHVSFGPPAISSTPAHHNYMSRGPLSPATPIAHAKGNVPSGPHPVNSLSLLSPTRSMSSSLSPRSNSVVSPQSPSLNLGNVSSLSSDPTAQQMSPVSPKNSSSNLVSSPSVQQHSSNRDETKESTPSSSADSDSDSDSVPGSPMNHPAGITLRKPGYYTIPSLGDLAKLVDSQGRCIVDNFTIGRLNYGNIFYPDSFDVANLDLDKLVHFRHKEVVVYPNDDEKPPVGQGLNRRAQITLDRVWPVDRTSREVISDPVRIAAIDFESKLRSASAKHGTRFIEYRPQTGSWVFKVNHFSKHGLTESDEEDCSSMVLPPTVQSLSGSGASVAAMRVAAGLNNKQLLAKQGMLHRSKQAEQLPGEIAPLADSIFMEDDDEDMMDNVGTQQIDLLEVEQMLSPTSKLSQQLGTSAHKLQLMKASFFVDDEIGSPVNERRVDYREKGKLSNLIKNAEEKTRSMSPLGVNFHERLLLGGDLSLHSSLAGVAALSDSKGLLPPLSSAHIPPRKQLPTSPIQSGESDMAEDESHIADEEDSMILGTEHSADLLMPVYGRDKCGISWRHSTASALDSNACAADITLGGGPGAKFRPGWGPDGSLLMLTTPAGLAGSTSSVYHLVGRAGLEDVSSDILVRVNFNAVTTAEFKELIMGHLMVALEYSEIEVDEWSRPSVLNNRDSIEELEHHFNIAESLLASAGGIMAVSSAAGTALGTGANVSRQSSSGSKLSKLLLHHQVWSLCQSLWGPLPRHVETNDVYSLLIERRQLLGEWLESVVRPIAAREADSLGESPAAVFSLMTCHDISGACDAAIAAGDCNLSAVICQSGGSVECQRLVSCQLREWRSTLADRHIDPNRLKLFTLASGSLTHEASDAFINCCQDLDWIRAFALCFWYVSWSTLGVSDAVSAYDTAWRKDNTAAPPYASDDISKLFAAGEDNIADRDCLPLSLLYHLIKLSTDKSYPLETILNPDTHSIDPSDYAMSWFLMRILTGLGYRHLSEANCALITNGFASQLESNGLWHWAVFVTMHLESVSRDNMVCDLIERHIVRETDDVKEKFLLEKLHIPSRWIARAKATRDIINERYEDAADNLLESEDWNTAHELIMEHIASEAIVNERYNMLERLLVQIDRREVSRWSTGGGVFLDYLTVMRITEELKKMNGNPDADNPLMEQLTMSLTNVIHKIKLLPCERPLDRLCQTEMGERLARLVLVMKDDLGGSGNGPQEILSSIPLPPDFGQSHWLELSEGLFDC